MISKPKKKNPSPPTLLFLSLFAISTLTHFSLHWFPIPIPILLAPPSLIFSAQNPIPKTEPNIPKPKDLHKDHTQNIFFPNPNPKPSKDYESNSK